MFEQFIPSEGPLIVSVDWTDSYLFTQWVFALPRDGRAYVFPCACGAGAVAIAERIGLAQGLKANSRKDRVMTLLRLGRQLLNRQSCKPKPAFYALQAPPT